MYRIVVLLFSIIILVSSSAQPPVEPPSSDATPQEGLVPSIDNNIATVEDPLITESTPGSERRIEKDSAIRPELMKKKNEVSNWIYFLYPTAQDEVQDAYALFRWREDGSELTKLTIKCNDYSVVEDCVYYTDYPLSGYEHGVLYLIKPEQEPKALADELSEYQIENGYIYYGHSSDTMGVGIEGHALHRIDLDGGNHIIAAYEAIGPALKFDGHIGNVQDGYVYYQSYRVKLGNPADGTEEIQTLAPISNDDGWLYYSTNRLFKAQPDGSKQTILDGNENSWISINKIEDEWIYYTDWSISMGDYGSEYKIRRDGTGKTLIQDVG